MFRADPLLAEQKPPVHTLRLSLVTNTRAAATKYHHPVSPASSASVSIITKTTTTTTTTTAPIVVSHHHHAHPLVYDRYLLRFPVVPHRGDDVGVLTLPRKAAAPEKNGVFVVGASLTS